MSTSPGEASGRVGVEKPTGKAIEPLSPGCRVPKVQGREERHPACGLFLWMTPSRWTSSGGLMARRAKRWHHYWRTRVLRQWDKRKGGGTPIAEGEDDGVVGGIGDTQSLSTEG